MSLPTRRQHCPLLHGGKGQDNQLATGWLFAFFQERCPLGGSTSLSAEARSALVIETSYCLAHASSPFLPPWWPRIGAHCASSRVTEQSPAYVQKKSYLVTLVVEIVLSGGCFLAGINIETQGSTCCVSTPLSSTIFPRCLYLQFCNRAPFRTLTSSLAIGHCL